MNKKSKIQILRGKLKMVLEVLLSRIGVKTYLADYNFMIKYLAKNKIYLLDGDIVEIGALMGGGTKKIAQFFANFEKRVHSIDIFNPDADNTRTVRGESLAKFYRALLGKRLMREIFDQNTKRQKNITIYPKDSREITFPHSMRLCFAFIDGNHSPEYVEYDFNLVWKHIVSGGIIAYDDYEGDMPQTTQAIKKVIEIHKEEIEVVDRYEKRRLIFIKKIGEL